VEEDPTKGKRADHPIHSKMISCCPPLFPRKNETEMVGMTEEIEMAGTTGVMWIVPIFLVPVMQ
jgi:hypothetical protein